MSDGTRLNAAQARAVARLIEENEEEGTTRGVLFVDNEYALGGGKLVKAYTPAANGRLGTIGMYWLIGEDGGVIRL